MNTKQSSNDTYTTYYVYSKSQLEVLGTSNCDSIFGDLLSDYTRNSLDNKFICPSILQIQIYQPSTPYLT